LHTDLGLAAFRWQIGGIRERDSAVPIAVRRAIDFELPDHEGKTWRLADNLANGPVVLVFYRGDW